MRALGRGWTFNWDISATTDNSGTVYIQQGSTTRVFTPAGNGWQATGSDKGVLTETKGAFMLREGDGTVTSFLANGQLNYVQDPSGNRVTAGYTGGLLTGLTHSNGDQLLFSYNAQNLISQVTDPAGRMSTYSYDAAKHLTAVTNVSGTYQYTYVTGMGITEEHALASFTDPMGRHSYFSYDAEGRLTQQSLDGGANALSYSYLKPGGYTVTDSTGAMSTILVGIDGQAAQITDAQGNVSRISFNVDGQPVLTVLPSGAAIASHFDNNGDLTSQTNALGNTSQFTVDVPSGRLLSFQNPLGATTSFSYTAQGNVSSITQPDGTTKQEGYNAQGLLTDSIDALGRTTQFSYDSHGRVIQQINPDGTSIVYTYDAFDNMTSVTDANGTISMSYDGAGRMTQITYPDGTYLKYTYDNSGKRTQMVDQTSFAENYAYDSVGRLMEITDGKGNMITSYTYNRAGLLSMEQNGNGAYTTYAYDTDGRLLHLINFAQNSTINWRLDYTYDNLGYVTAVTTLAGTTTYSYDADGQLISVVLPGGRTITYQYDAAGNRGMVTDNGTPTDYTANNVNEYTNVGGYSYSYDANGNLTVMGGQGGNTTYTYDTLNRLIGIKTPNDTWSFQYDALGSLVAATHNGQTTHYLVDPLSQANIVGEFDGSGNLVAHYAYGIGLTSRVDAMGDTAYYDFDALGNTAELTGTGGVVLNSYSYLPFGELLSASGTVANPFQYGGAAGVTAMGSGLDFMRSRFYSPVDGRFLNRDPVGLAGGAQCIRLRSK